jgi:PAS domain S-box-containing protein
VGTKVERTVQTRQSPVESLAESTTDIAKASPIRVLLVDDDACFLMTSKQCLETQGHFQIDTASSADEAMEKMKETKYDAVVSDYQMPEKDGLQFLKELRQKGNNIPFIVFTGKGREEVVIKALNQGADHYENKNGNPETIYSELSHDIINSVKTRRTEQELRIQREELQVILDSLPLQIWYKDMNNRLLRVNKAFVELMGVSKENLEGRPLCDLFPPDLAQKCWEEDKEVLTTGKPKTDILDRYETPQGVRLFSTGKVPCKDKDGNVTSIINFSVDITERNKAENALKESEGKYRTLANSLPEIIFEADGQGNLIVLNERAYSMTGYTKEDFAKGLNALDFPIPEHRSRAQENLKKVLTGEKTRAHAYTFQKKDGSTFPILISCNPVFDKGKIVGLRGIIVDISERARMEEELQRFSSAVKMSSEGVVITDLNGKISEANEAASRFYDANTKDELIGKNALELVDPQERHLVVKRMKEATQKGSTPSHEYCITASSGKKLFIELTTTALRNKDGNHHGFVSIIRDVTERHAREKELKESEAKYRVLVEQSLQGILVVQEPGPHLAFTNPAMSSIFGYTPEELASLSPQEITDLVHPEDQDVFLRRLKNRLRGKPAQSHYEIRGIRKDGTLVWLDVSATSIEYNGLPAAQAIFVDVTERRKAEEALRNSEERWRSLAEDSPDYIMLLDLKGNILYINRTVPDLKREKVIGTSLFNYVPPEWHRVAKDCFKRVIETGKADHYDTEYRTKDGEVKYFEGRVGPVFQENRVAALISSSTDVTLQKKAEEELRESEQKFRCLVEEAAAYVGIIDLKGQFTYVNKALAHSLGYSVQELTGHPFKDFLHPNDRSKITRLFLKGIVLRKKTQSLDFRVIRKDGHILHWTTKATRYAIEGKTVGFQAIITDITEREDADKKLKIGRKRALERSIEACQQPNITRTNPLPI